jgi:hypothetical protein
LIYDMAGRAEDALHLDWKNIVDLGEAGGRATFTAGKTVGGTQALTKETMALLK